MEDFAHIIEKWYDQFGRDLPWRQTRNPYHIWLSEIILQQTRVEQGWEYYQRFISTYPDVHALAVAPEVDVMRLWQGLGYYSRARNLHAAAKIIDSDYGTFPSDYQQVRSLPGIGDYTAAAIVSFAFDQPYAVLDGNVYRVLARYFNIETPIDTTTGKYEFATLAQQLLDVKFPAHYNQAIMDFGAIQCKPHSPECNACPLVDSCQAYFKANVDVLPIKSKKISIKDRYMTYIRLHTSDGKLLIHQRDNRDIWQGLYEFPLIESSKPLSASEVKKNCPQGELTLVTKGFVHQLTHQRLHVDFYDLLSDSETCPFDGIWIEQSDLERYGLPQLLVKLLDKLPQ